MDYCRIGKNIREARRCGGLTQEQLAELADVSPTYVSHIERGTKSVSLRVLVRCAAALDTTVDQLLCEGKGTDIPPL